VFCAQKDAAFGDETATTVCVSTRETWEKDGCQSDSYTDEEGSIVDAVCDKYGLVGWLETTYECQLPLEEITELLGQEPDFAYDEGFAKFIESHSD